MFLEQGLRALGVSDGRDIVPLGPLLSKVYGPLVSPMDGTLLPWGLFFRRFMGPWCLRWTGHFYLGASSFEGLRALGISDGRDIVPCHVQTYDV